MKTLFSERKILTFEGYTQDQETHNYYFTEEMIKKGIIILTECSSDLIKPDGRPNKKPLPYNNIKLLVRGEELVQEFYLYSDGTSLSPLIVQQRAIIDAIEVVHMNINGDLLGALQTISFAHNVHEAFKSEGLKALFENDLNTHLTAAEKLFVGAVVS